MAGAGKKWLAGCGIGCGLMILILGGVGTCGYLGVKKIKEQADAFEVTSSDLTDRFGDPAAYTPNPDGSISPDRMEVFLAIRDSMRATREATATILGTLEGDANWVAKAQAGMEMIPSMMTFLGEGRNDLLEQGMGVGEYGHIYVVAYYSYLGNDPGDGPGFTVTGDENDHSDSNVGIRWNGEDEGDVRESRARRVRKLVNRQEVQLLDNQIAALEAGAPAGTDLEADAWGAQLYAERKAMSIESLRFPWEDGLPDPLRISLEPYRERLAASYDSLTSVVEMGMIYND